MSLMDDDLHDPEFYSDEPHVDEYCEHEDDPRTCPVASCNPAAAVKVEEPDVGPAFAARFPGRCPSCDTSIEVDDMLRVVNGTVVHDGDCAKYWAEST